MATKQKTVVVTGASQGIGAAIANLFLDRGYNVVANSRNITRKAELRRAENLALVDGDIALATTAERIIATAVMRFGSLDALVNNAGIGMAGRFLETTPAHWDNILAVNLRGVLNGSRSFATQMVDRGQGGTIINVSSAAAFLPSKSMIAYCTTKAAVLAFSESLRADLADDGITVTAVCPGFVNTNIAKSTVYAGMTADEQEHARHRADSAYRRRIYTPEATARGILPKCSRATPTTVLIGSTWAMSGRNSASFSRDKTRWSSATRSK